MGAFWNDALSKESPDFLFHPSATSPDRHTSQIRSQLQCDSGLERFWRGSSRTQRPNQTLPHTDLSSITNPETATTAHNMHAKLTMPCRSIENESQGLRKKEKQYTRKYELQQILKLQQAQ